MRIAAVQMVSTPDVARNLATARHLLEEAAGRGASIAALPEYFCFMGQLDTDKRALAEDEGDGPIQAMLAQAARELGLWIIGGTVPLRGEGRDKLRNSCLVFSPEGRAAARYDKIHLFCFDNGRERYDEGRVLEPGSRAVAVETAGLRCGLSVCYDLRFPELYRALGPCDLISVPSAFTYTTGEKHWELLLRARAVENQCYVIAAAQGGRHENGRRTWGHSMVVDPWGEMLACVPEGEGLAVAEFDPQRLRQVREQLPALQHRVF
ncbi:MAG: carbon-nitrogen hydrolase family protein [Paucibacter sp.]|nr:carbon-nitrogen hydrolase family protein [Roseateles sp.]